MKVVVPRLDQDGNRRTRELDDQHEHRSETFASYY